MRGPVQQVATAVAATRASQYNSLYVADLNESFFYLDVAFPRSLPRIFRRRRFLRSSLCGFARYRSRRELFWPYAAVSGSWGLSLASTTSCLSACRRSTSSMSGRVSRLGPQSRRISPPFGTNVARSSTPRESAPLPSLPAVWRALTFPFFHVGLLHLLFNMMAWVPLGGCGSASSKYHLRSFILRPPLQPANCAVASS